MRGLLRHVGPAPAPPVQVMPQAGERAFCWELAAPMAVGQVRVEFGQWGIVVSVSDQGRTLGSRLIPWERIDSLPELPPVEASAQQQPPPG